MRTCDYLPEDNRTHWSCAWDWNCRKSISSSCRRRQWIVPSWHLKPLLLLYNTIQSSHVCSMVESRVLQIQVNLKKNKHTRQIPDGNKIESPYTKNHIHMQIITSFANFTQLYRFSYCDIRFNSKFDTVFGFVLKFYAKWYNIVSDMTVISK